MKICVQNCAIDLKKNNLCHFCSMQKSMKAEMEMAMKLLEKDVHHKQDTIVCLRDQLEDIKDINLEMYTKLAVPTTLRLYCAQ